MREGVYVAGAEGEGGERACMSRARKEREERGRVCRRRSVTGACMSRERSFAEEGGGNRACMLREECYGRRGRREGVYVAG